MVLFRHRITGSRADYEYFTTERAAQRSAKREANLAKARIYVERLEGPRPSIQTMLDALNGNDDWVRAHCVVFVYEPTR